MIYPILSLLFTVSFCSFQDEFPVQHWLEPASWTEHICYYPADNDPNLLIMVTTYSDIHLMDMTDFAGYSRVYLRDSPLESAFKEITDPCLDP